MQVTMEDILMRFGTFVLELMQKDKIIRELQRENEKLKAKIAELEKKENNSVSEEVTE